MSDQGTHLEEKAQELSQALEAELAALAKEFNEKVESTGTKFGVRLGTEVSFLIKN